MRDCLMRMVLLPSHCVLCDKVLERRTFTEVGVPVSTVRRRRDYVKPHRHGGQEVNTLPVSVRERMRHNFENWEGC